MLTTPGDAWEFADMGFFSFQILNPGAPIEPYNGTNPTTANPLPITTDIAPIRATGGGLTTGGTTDLFNDLDSGNILHEFVAPPFSSNGAWLIFDIGAGGSAQGQLCLFFSTAGCIAGATQAVVIAGQFSHFGPDTDGDGYCDSCDDFDDDGDGIRDSYDTDLLVPNNVCTGGDSDNATLGEMIVGDRSCAAKVSVNVQAPTHVMPPDGDLLVIGPLIKIQSGVTVGGRLKAIPADPCPAILQGCN